MRIPQHLRTVASSALELAPVEIPRRGRVRRAEISRVLPAAPCIVEVGAHRGYDTLAMSRRWPSGAVYAFEPVTALRRDLERRVRGRPNVTVIPAAVSSADGWAKIHVSSGGSDASSSLHEPHEHLIHRPDVLFEVTETVETVTLDSWARAAGVTRVDLLWLDAQGHELDALRGAAHVLDTVTAIYTEVALKRNYVDGVLYEDLKEWLRIRSFVPTIERIPWADGGNVLFTRVP